MLDALETRSDAVEPAAPEPRLADLQNELFRLQHSVQEMRLQISRLLTEVTSQNHKPQRPTQPLLMRLVFQPVMSDLVRAVRYDELSVAEFQPRLAALAEKHGAAAVEAAMAEILVPMGAGLWRLSHEARAQAYQIIGASSEASTRKNPPKESRRSVKRKK